MLAAARATVAERAVRDHHRPEVLGRSVVILFSGLLEDPQVADVRRHVLVGVPPVQDVAILERGVEQRGEGERPGGRHVPGLRLGVRGERREFGHDLVHRTGLAGAVDVPHLVQLGLAVPAEPLVGPVTHPEDDLQRLLVPGQVVGVEQTPHDLVAGVPRRPDRVGAAVRLQGRWFEPAELALREGGEVAGVAGPDDGGVAVVARVVDGGLALLLEAVPGRQVRRVGLLGRRVRGGERLHLGGGQCPAVDPEVVDRRVQVRVVVALRPADPVVGGRAQVGRGESDRVRADLVPVDVEPAGVVRRGDGDRHVRPPADGDRVAGAVDALLVVGPAGGDGEPWAHVGRHPRRQRQVDVRTGTEIEDLGIGLAGGEPHPDCERHVGDAVENPRGQQHVLVRVRVAEPYGLAGPAGDPAYRPRVQRSLALAQLLDEIVELVEEDLLTGGGVALRQHRQVVPGEVPAQQVVRGVPAARPGARCGQTGVGPEEVQHPVRTGEDAAGAGVVPGVVEHPVALLLEDPLVQGNLVEVERLGGGRATTTATAAGGGCRGGGRRDGQCGGGGGR